MPSPILARADALMHRQRKSAGTDELPVLTDAVTPATADDDIPILLDVAASAPRQPAQPKPPAAPAPEPAKAAGPKPFPTIDSKFLDDAAPAAPAPAINPPPAATTPAQRHSPSPSAPAASPLPAAPAPNPPAKPSAPAAAVLAKLAASSREDIARDIAHRVELRLVAELPRLIAAAVRDYLAEQNAAPR
ncbi:MAG: hypothetical protein FWF20_03235 [Betaproteobacteria bacterium]|nr:hypothetical protein [Betaproteobacteria bacterium]MCL2885795.1 hypothetical protein [Betaproteobacteria bacterium]